MIIDYSESAISGPENIVSMPDTIFLSIPLTSLKTVIYLKGSTSREISIDGSLSQFAGWIAPAGNP